VKSLDNRKVNKSGRFDPDLIEKIEKRVEEIGIKNLSQGLEFLVEVGFAAIDPTVWIPLSKKASANRRTYSDQVKSVLQKYIQEQK